MTTPDAPDPAALLWEWHKTEQAATPGEWKLHVAEGRSDWSSGSKAFSIPRVEADARPGGIGVFDSPADAEFTATARTAFPILLAAVEAALAMHQPGRATILGALCKRHENHRHFSIDTREAEGVRSCPDCEATVSRSCTGCGPGVTVDACPTVRAITAALTGKEAGT